MEQNEGTLANTLKTGGVGALEVYRDSLVAAEQSHHDVTGATQAQIDKVNALIATVNTTPPEKTTKFNADTQAAANEMDQLNSKANDTAKPRTIDYQVDISAAITELDRLNAKAAASGGWGWPKSTSSGYQAVRTPTGTSIVPTAAASRAGGASGGRWWWNDHQRQCHRRGVSVLTARRFNGRSSRRCAATSIAMASSKGSHGELARHTDRWRVPRGVGRIDPPVRPGRYRVGHATGTSARTRKLVSTRATWSVMSSSPAPPPASGSTWRVTPCRST